MTFDEWWSAYGGTGNHERVAAEEAWEAALEEAMKAIEASRANVTTPAVEIGVDIARTAIMRLAGIDERD